jgi:hypothetical protein
VRSKTGRIPQPLNDCCVPPCVALSRCRPPCRGVHGRIADGVGVLGRSVRTVGCFTDGHGRAAPAAYSGSTGAAWPDLLAGASGSAAGGTALGCPCRVHESVPVADARLDVIPACSWRRVVPCYTCRVALLAGRQIRRPPIGVGWRAAMLALTSPACVPAGQRADVPEIYLCAGRDPRCPRSPSSAAPLLCGRLRPRWRGLAAGGGVADVAVASARRA